MAPRLTHVTNLAECRFWFCLRNDPGRGLALAGFQLGDFRLTNLAGHSLTETTTARLIALGPGSIERMVGRPDALGLPVGSNRRLIGCRDADPT
jgi:hypothetical protein